MRLRKGLYIAFLLWPFALGMPLASLPPFSLGDRPAVRVLFSSLLIPVGIAFNALWIYSVDRFGLAQRVHDSFGLPRNPSLAGMAPRRRK